jgi:hypothetical protein
MSLIGTTARWFDRVRYYDGPWAVPLAIVMLSTVAYGIKWSMEALVVATRGVALVEPPPPKPPARSEAPPPPLASAVAQCFPVLTEDAHLLELERCDRQGGFASSGWVFVDCWQGHPYENGSHLIWHYGVEQAALDDAKAMLKEWP